MALSAIRKTFHFEQINTGTPEQVFPLLCPVREKDWLDGWEYEMIFSKSGVVEQDCVFSTPHHGELKTIWYVTHHNKNNHIVEFIRTTPDESVVKINIQLSAIDESKTKAHITYQYLGLNEVQNQHIENQLEKEFTAAMYWWQKAINHFLTTGTKLLKN